MIVVATENFELYHEVVGELRDRGVTFTTVEPGADLPERTRVVIAAPDDDRVEPGTTVGEPRAQNVGAPAQDVEFVTATPAEARRAVEEALALLRGGGGRLVVGVDPGTRPGIAVRSGDTVVAAFHVPLAQAVETVRQEVEGATDPLVRVGDGARLQGARIVNGLDDVPVELVDETGTTPYLGTGARGMGDVLAAVNIAHLPGERVGSREVDPTPGELQVIKNASRERSTTDRTIDEGLARRVAAGELTIEEALAEHRGDATGEQSGTGGRNEHDA